MNTNIPIQNRLVIIGNGFDIANNLPTRYSDFMKNFLFKKIILAFDDKNGFYEDDYLIILKLNKNSQFNLVIDTPLKNYFAIKSNRKYHFDLGNFSQTVANFKLYEPEITEIYFHVKDEFLNQLFDKVEEYNWVDIELEYYHKLLELTIDNDPINSLIKKYSVEFLHKSFQMIQGEFIKYLKTLNFEKYSGHIAEIFDYPLNYDFKHRIHNRKDETRIPNETLILNFNYTPTIEYYRQKAHWQNEFQIIYIHGEIVDDDNPIIFGYGDETVPSYKKLEDLNNNEYLRFMKNKDYAKTTNYAKLISFIEQGVSFEVYILGHSCGLSDRVMLNTIFENEFCESIYIFYHQKENGTDNFIETYHSISRQFSLEKRADLRKKVKAKSVSMAFPKFAF